ncbi:helix-turn-helix transcriptional regulator [Streptomyces sp. NPDC001251]
MLSTLGLDPTAEAVYQLMATRPEGWGVEQITEHLGRDGGEVREALDRLAEAELLRQSVGRPGTWRAVSPELGVRLLLRRQQDELDRRQREITAAHDEVGRMISRLRAGATAASGTDIEQLVGIDAIQSRLDLIAARAAEEICTFMPGGAQSQAALDAAKPNDALLLSRGVAMRTVCLDSVRGSAPTLGYARWLAESGGEVRTVPTLSPRMIVVDRECALVPLDPSDTRAGAVVLRVPGVVAALMALFERVWVTALPLGCAAPREERTGLTPQERALLTLLGRGITDEAAARQLGVSLSTVRRAMAALMERLGARSRFEAGLRAAQRGWC